MPQDTAGFTWRFKSERGENPCRRQADCVITKKILYQYYVFTNY